PRGRGRAGGIGRRARGRPGRRARTGPPPRRATRPARRAARRRARRGRGGSRRPSWPGGARSGAASSRAARPPRRRRRRPEASGGTRGARRGARSRGFRARRPAPPRRRPRAPPRRAARARGGASPRRARGSRAPDRAGAHGVRVALRVEMPDLPLKVLVTERPVNLLPRTRPFSFHVVPWQLLPVPFTFPFFCRKVSVIVSNVPVPPVSVQSTPRFSTTGVASPPHPKSALVPSTVIVSASGAEMTTVNGPPTWNVISFHVPVHVPASVVAANGGFFAEAVPARARASASARNGDRVVCMRAGSTGAPGVQIPDAPPPAGARSGARGRFPRDGERLPVGGLHPDRRHAERRDEPQILGRRVDDPMHDVGGDDERRVGPELP